MTDSVTSLPFAPADVRWTPVSPRLASARLTSLAIWVAPPLLVLVVLSVFATPWCWIPAGVVAGLGLWAALLIPRQVRAMAYAERDDDLLIRSGVLFRTMVVVPYGRMQFVDVSAGPLARKFGIASLELHTASPATMAALNGLPPAEADRLREQLTSRGEARLAGL